MGLLDKAVKEEIAKEEQKTKEEMDKFSSEVLELKKEKDIGESIRPLIIQGLKEFTNAMEQIGAEPLPLVLAREPSFLESFFESTIYRCVWGYYLYPHWNGYETFITTDGKYLEGYTKIPEAWNNKKFKMNRSMLQTPDIERRKYPDGTKGELYFGRTHAYYEKEILEDQAVSLIIQDFLHHRKTPEKTEHDNIKYVRLTEALEKNDLETAVTELFSIYIRANKAIWSQYRGERMDFLRSLDKK